MHTPDIHYAATTKSAVEAGNRLTMESGADVSGGGATNTSQANQSPVLSVKTHRQVSGKVLDSLRLTEI
jgi:hypothetical protein